MRRTTDLDGGGRRRSFAQANGCLHRAAHDVLGMSDGRRARAPNVRGDRPPRHGIEVFGERDLLSLAERVEHVLHARRVEREGEQDLRLLHRANDVEAIGAVSRRAEITIAERRPARRNVRFEFAFELLRTDAAYAAKLSAEFETVRNELGTAETALAKDALRRLDLRLSRLLRRARLGRIESVLGKKRALEVEIEAINAGYLPKDALDSLDAARYMRDNEEYWPFEGDDWPDEFVGSEGLK